jgi:7-carboxy-7-deazaguanine synthase
MGTTYKQSYNKKMKISEIFESLQGEGKYIGYPALFIRTSGCNLNCSFCDTKYHKYGKEININEIIKRIKNSKLEIVVWTGGEPTLQIKEISDIINNTKTKKHHLETNGTNLTNQLINFFDYICISPKKLDEAKKSYEFREKYPDKVDVKVVTDFKENKDLIPYANILMPLERGIPKLDKELRKIMWIYCVNNNLRYSPRIQTLVWRYKKKGK